MEEKTNPESGEEKSKNVKKLRSLLNPKYPQNLNEFIYKGVLWAGWTDMAMLQRIENDFQFRRDDILIMTYPKSGTTMAQELVWLLINRLNYTRAQHNPIYVRVPFLEHTEMLDFPSEADPNNHKTMLGIDYLQEMAAKPAEDCPPRRRIIKTHLPWSMVRPALARSDTLHHTKKIVIIRNPRDTAVSYYHFYRGITETNGYNESWSAFLHMWLDNWIINGCLADWIEQVWSATGNKEFCARTNMLIVFYEDLVKRPVDSIRKLMQFLLDDDTRVTPPPVYTEQQLAGLASHVHFDSMKKNRSVNYEDAPGFSEGFVFMRSGKVGDWKNWFTEDQMAAWNAKYEKRYADMQIPLQYE